MTVPPIDPAQEPAFVRHGGAAAQRAYREALGFEQVLVDQFAQQLGGAMSSDAGPFSSLLPDALTSGIMAGGGLGIAAQLVPSLDPALRGGR